MSLACGIRSLRGEVCGRVVRVEDRGCPSTRTCSSLVVSAVFQLDRKRKANDRYKEGKLLVSKRSSEAQNIPQTFRERMHMLKSARKSLIVSFEKIAVLALVLSLLSAGAAFAAAGGNPGPPHLPPPLPPCISTGLLSESNSNGGCYSCNVRNVGGTSHNVTIDLRDAQNPCRLRINGQSRSSAELRLASLTSSQSKSR